MAVVVTPTFNKYTADDQALQDHILDIYGAKENEVDFFRPTLADQHKIGFFGLDRPSQTELTEIVELKEMTEVLQILLKDVANLKKDINIARHVIQADYESKLKEKSLDLYCRINERVTELEKMHHERAGTIRRAFRQQLSDAIVRVGTLFNKSLEEKMTRIRSSQASEQDKQDEQYKELKATIQHNETVIHMLTLQLTQIQARKASVDTASERPSNVTPFSGTPVSPRQHMASATPEALPPPPSPMPPQHSPPRHGVEEVTNNEAEELKGEVNRLNNTVEELKSILLDKKVEVSSLNEDVEKLNAQLDEERLQIEMMSRDKESLQKSSEADKELKRKMLEKQKREMEKVMEEKLRQAREEMMSSSQQQTMSLQETEKKKLQQLLEEKKSLQEQLQKERSKDSNKSQTQLDMDKMSKNEKRMKEEIERLKKEIERLQRTWEKKFAILQQSLHALKDESYLRQTMQRQSATLHQASISYAVDTPVGIVPTLPNQPNSAKKPLPDIGRSGKPADFLSYTVSAPSGRGSALFSVDENQVMSDSEQDLPSDVMHLPDPPMRPRPRSRTSSVHT